LEQVCLDDASRCLEVTLRGKDLEDVISKKSVPTEKQRIQEREAERKKSKDAKKEGKNAKNKKEEQEEETEPVALSAPMSSFETIRGRHIVSQAKAVLKEMEEKNRQHRINGNRDAWIIKPSGKSRGRGIQMLRELDEIFRATESEGYQWICQKYIEQPQLIHGYKFDMRQWVLVTDWNPLTVYIWQQPYIRFAGQKYDESLSDRSEYMHLVNNSIIKHMDGFEEKNEDLQTSGYMWFRQQYEEWLHDTHCKCKRHRTPFLKPPPYTCSTFGVCWEDVKWTAKDEDDDDDEEDDSGPPKTLGATGPATESTSSPAAHLSSSPASPSSKDDRAEKVDKRDSSAQQAPSVPLDRESRGASTPRADVSSMSAGPASKNSDASDGNDSGEECENLWDTCIKKQIEDIVTWSLLCVVDTVQHRKGSVELYGYDFMVSSGQEKPQVWLIEVNSSPACDYSTPISCPLVKQMMEDTAKVMVDLKADPEASTGEWELLRHPYNKTVSQRCTTSPSLEVIGKQIKAPKGFKKSITSKRSGSSDEQEEAEGDAGDAAVD